jgi:Animal haem peroxidase
MGDFGHGAVGTREQAFTTLLPLRTAPQKTELLVALAASIQAVVDEVKDGADGEENLWMPAGYTYFGQFIDHDLTFDNTSSLNPADIGGKDRAPTNLRTPRFDLDSVYGDGPDAQPFMYAEDGASMLIKDSFENQCQSSFDQAHQDLLRSPNGRAIIGDKRNDENSIISQIQLSFIKFHNAVVTQLKKKQPEVKGTALFNEARNQVRWAYQKLVIEDFLPRIVKAEVLKGLNDKTQKDRHYALYDNTPDKRRNLPREFVGAAYRFGHSGVRFGYRLNTTTRLSIFVSSNHPERDSLLGFDPLPQSQVIDDWGRFFPSTDPNTLPSTLGSKPTGKDGLDENPAVRLQFAYKIDPTLVDPLTILPPSVLPTSTNPKGAIQEIEDTIGSKLPDPKGRPSLALLNLLRGNTYLLPSGQVIAAELKAKGYPVEPLASKYLVTRQVIKDSNGVPTTQSKFKAIDPELQKDTPLWFYVLAEAQKSIIDALCVTTETPFDEERLREPAVSKTQLGWVGGRIIAEVFYGLMDSDEESYFNKKELKGKDFQPIWADDPSIGKAVIFANLLKFAGQTITVPPVTPPAKGC